VEVSGHREGVLTYKTVERSEIAKPMKYIRQWLDFAQFNYTACHAWFYWVAFTTLCTENVDKQPSQDFAQYLFCLE
jgi:hypothetical protein